MAAATQTQAVIQKAAATVVAPVTLGFVDCIALLLSFLLMFVAAVSPGATPEE